MADLPKDKPGKQSGLKNIWKWSCFLAWLPWFFITWPWQIKKACQQFDALFSFSRDELTEEYPLEPEKQRGPEIDRFINPN
jgi:hypothetical protein